MRDACVRLSVLTTSTALLLTSVVSTAPARADQPDLRDEVRGRTGRVIVSADQPSVPAARPAPSAPTSTPPAGQRAAADPGPCDWSSLWAVPFADRVQLEAGQAGAATLTVQRRRSGGAWQPVFTHAGEMTTRDDYGVNTATYFSYRLTARSSSGAVLRDCVTGEMSTVENDGWAAPDFAIGSVDGLARRSRYSVLDPAAVRAPAVTPDYSADGRLVAVTEIDPATGRGTLVVRRAQTLAPEFTVDLGEAVTPADAAFSPDGQTLAFTRYENQSGTSLGLGFVDVHGSHVVRSHPSALPLGEPAWRRDSTSLIASDLREGGGLVTTCTSCATVTALAGTTGGYTPAVGLDGAVVFSLTDATTSRVVRQGPSGLATLAFGTPSEILSSPTFAPNGDLHYQVDDLDIVSGEQVAGRVWTRDASGATGSSMNAFYGMVGFGVRQPQGKDSSDVVGDGHHDVLARDASGVLWAYTAKAWGLGARVRLGSGWNAFTRILSAGDLTGDDRSDIVATDSLGRLWLWKGTGRGVFAAKVQIGSGWSSAYTLVAPGDLTGDQRADLVARDASGALWVYSGTGRGTVGARVSLGTGWGGMTAILGSGDVDFDNRTDLVSRDTRGRLWLWPGDGRGRLGAARLIGSGWGSFTAISITGVTNQVAHVWARTSSGVLGYYDLHADGTFSPNGFSSLGSGWNAMNVITS